MVRMDIGQACIKTAGREEGQICAVIDTVDENFVMVTGPRVRRKRCNVKHFWGNGRGRSPEGRRNG